MVHQPADPSQNPVRDNLPKGRLELSDRDEYHALLDTAQKELGSDLSAYRIPDTAIKSIEIPHSFSVDMFGNTSGSTHHIERFIPSRAFKSKLDALLAFLNQKRS
jgi:hypothetical protein